VIIPTTYCG